MSRNSNRTSKGKFIPFFRPGIGPEEENAVRAVLRSGWLTTGGVAEKFEHEFAKYIGSPFAVAVNSATAGLHIGLESLHVGPGDLIITSPYSFISSAEVARYLGAHPYFVDIETDSFNIDPDLVERALKKKNGAVRCILPIHVGGHPCRMEALKDLADHFTVPILEDAAHALPCRTALGAAGTIGEIGVFSFYATKTVTTGEGGMLVTKDPKLAERAAILRLHGVDRAIWDRYTAERPVAWEYDIVAAGYKYNLTDIAAAIGREQLKKADAFLERRKSIAGYYTERFKKFDFIRLPPSSDDHCWHLFIVRLDLSKITIGRDEFVQLLMEAGVGASVHFKPLHLMTYYREMYGFKAHDFPAALSAYREAISLPVYPSLTDSEAQRVADELIRIASKHYRPG